MRHAGRPLSVLQRHALAVGNRLRHRQALARQMRHQRQEPWQVAGIDALFIQRQEEPPARRLDEIIAVLDALGDALETGRHAELITGEKAGKVGGGNLRIDRHASRLFGGEGARQLEDHLFDSGRHILGRTVKRCPSSASTSCTSTSGAEAPAVSPSVLMPSNQRQSISAARPMR